MSSPPGSIGSEYILTAEHLTRTVGDRSIVNDISIQVRAGEILGIVGPSGSGKSSFLRLLNRLDEPTSGTVFLRGVDYRQIAPRELRRQVGMVTQRPFLFPGTIAENLGFGPRQRGETLSRQECQQLLSRVGLNGYADRDVANLSGGEAQRVSIARALANSPAVLLLDEPTSALDEDAKAGVEALLREIIRDHNLTCVIVTHDMAQAARIAERVLLVEGGKVRKIGTVQEVLRA
ncbi:MAG TPA: phosphate ABC transporter ATP-binding protein [Candidatus Limnocylindrales bacterium]|nr:phosphate ABC transporter ATP-binding protein [Candidatus Limnocylindrales bacterium]